MRRQTGLRDRITLLIPLSLAIINASLLHAQECSQGWQPFVVAGNIGVNGQVNAMTIWNGNLVIGGSFTVAGGTLVNGIARWDGVAWHPFGSGFSNGSGGRDVRALTVWNGDLIAAGNFTGVTGAQTVNHIARWNGNDWQPFTSNGHIGVTSTVNALIQWNGDLYVGGDFITVANQTVNRIARWDGDAWHPLTSGGQIGVNGGVDALTIYNLNLVAAGGMSQAGGQVVNFVTRWDGEQWHAFASGNQIGVNSGIGGRPSALTVDNNGSLVLGGFSLGTAGGQTINSIARWDGSAWHPFTSGGQIGLSGAIFTVRALTMWNGDLIAAGEFTTAGGQTANRIARWNGSAWHPLIVEGQIGVDNAVRALISFNGDLIAAGSFMTAGGQTVNRIAAWGITDGGEQFWTGPKGGSGSGLFHNPENWLCDLVPSGFATVIFDHDVSPLAPAYSLSLASDAAVRRLKVHTDEVTVNLTNRNFSLTAIHNDPIPSLIVGEYANEDARLIVRNSLTLPRRLNSASISIGDGFNSIGRLTVRNTSITSPLSAGMTADGNITLGRLGHGTMIVENRADVEYGRAGSYLYIGDEAQGSLTVRTGGLFVADDFIDIVSIGREQDAIGEVTITGAGSLWTGASNFFFIGESGHASMTVSNGGALYSATLDDLQLGVHAGSTANVTITGPNSIWFEAIQPITLGGNGDATIHLLDGGMIEALNVNTLSKGRVEGDGFIVADLFNFGSVMPQDSQGDPGSLTVAGNYRQIGTPPGESTDRSGKLRIAIGDSGASQLIVNGTAELGGGVIVEALPDFKPQLGSTVQLLTAGSIHPQHRTFDVAYFPPLAEKFLRVNYPNAALDGGGSITISVEDLSTILNFDPQFIGEPGSATAAVVADFNGDARDDIAVTLTNGSSMPGDLLVLLNTPTGIQTTQYFGILGISPSAIDAGELRQNGTFDLAITNRHDGIGAGSLMVLANDGQGAFTLHGSPIALGVNPSSVAIGRFVNPGTPRDVAVANEISNTVMVLRNVGNGVLQSHTNKPVEVKPVRVRAGDLDNPRDLSHLIVASAGASTVSVHFNNGTGSFPTSSSYAVDLEPRDLVLADLNNDGLTDVLTANAGAVNSAEGSVSVLVNTGLGAFTLAPAVNLPIAGSAPYSLVTANLGSVAGNEDVAVLVNTDEGPKVRVLRNDTDAPSGSMPIPTVALTLLDEAFDAGDGAIAIVAGDLDGQNGVDLVTIGSANNFRSATGSIDGGEPSAVRLLANLGIGGKPNPCPADIAPQGGDGLVGVADLLAVIASWNCTGTPGQCAADIAPVGGDGVVGVADLLLVIASWNCSAN